MTTEQYKFTKGQRLHLDDIYFIQGLAGGNWWEPDDKEGSDSITITKDVKIRITYEVRG